MPERQNNDWPIAEFPTSHCKYQSSFSGTPPVSDPRIKTPRRVEPPIELVSVDQLIFEVYETGELNRLIDRS